MLCRVLGEGDHLQVGVTGLGDGIVRVGGSREGQLRASRQGSRGKLPATAGQFRDLLLQASQLPHREGRRNPVGEEHPRVGLSARGHSPRLVLDGDAGLLEYVEEPTVELRRDDGEVAERLHNVLGVRGRAEVDADRHPVGLGNVDVFRHEVRHISCCDVLGDVEVEVFHAAAKGELLAPVGDGERASVVDLRKGNVRAAEEVQAKPGSQLVVGERAVAGRRVDIGRREEAPLRVDAQGLGERPVSARNSPAVSPECAELVMHPP